MLPCKMKWTKSYILSYTNILYTTYTNHIIPHMWCLSITPTTIYGGSLSVGKNGFPTLVTLVFCFQLLRFAHLSMPIVAYSNKLAETDFSLH